MTSTVWNPMSAKASRGPRHRAPAGRDAAWRVGLAGLVVALAACGGGSGGSGGVTPPPPDPPVVTVPPAVTAIGDPIGAVATARVGPAGGSLASADGQVELVVPAGALAGEVELTATPISATAPGGVRAYRLGPEGTTFAVPVTVRFKLSEADLAGSSADVAGVAYQDAQRQWRVLQNSAYANGQISVQTKHLSDWSALLGWQLRPPSAVVGVGKSLPISIQYCGRVNVGPSDEDQLISLAGLCTLDEDMALPIRNWSVNGLPGGSTTFGTVARGNPTATYAAPSHAPTPALVAVSVEVQPDSATSQLMRLVSNITVVEGPPSYVGTVHFSGPMVADGSAHLTWTPVFSNSDPDAVTLEYIPSGTVSALMNPYPEGKNYECPSIPVTLPIAPDQGPTMYILKGASPPWYGFSFVASRPNAPLLEFDCVYKATGERSKEYLPQALSLIVSPGNNECPVNLLKDLNNLTESAYVCIQPSANPPIKASWSFTLQE